MFNLNPFAKKKQDVNKNMVVPKVDTTPGTGVAIGNLEVATPTTESLSDSSILNLYLSNTWVRKYINILVNGCLRYPIQARIREGHETDPNVDAHLEDIQNLLKNPNAIEPFRSIRSKYLKDLFLFGNGAMEISPQEKAKGKVTDLHAAPGYLLRVATDEFGNIDPKKAYSFVDPTTGMPLEKIYPSSGIIHFKLDELSDRVYGTSALAVASSEFTTDSKTTKVFEGGMGAISPTLISFPKTSIRFVDNVIAKLQTLYSGKSGVKIAGINVDAKDIKLSNATPDSAVNFQRWIALRHNVFQIPAFKLGIADSAGALSTKEQREEFLSFLETIIQYECDLLTLALIKNRFGYDDIEIIAPNIITRVEFDKTRVVERLVKAGVITPNEGRTRYLGLPPSDEPRANSLQFPEDKSGAAVEPKAAKKPTAGK